MSGAAGGVAYAATALGRSLTEHVLPLARWALEHRDGIRAARAHYDGTTGS